MNIRAHFVGIFQKTNHKMWFRIWVPEYFQHDKLKATFNGEMKTNCKLN